MNITQGYNSLNQEEDSEVYIALIYRVNDLKERVRLHEVAGLNCDDDRKCLAVAQSALVKVRA